MNDGLLCNDVHSGLNLTRVARIEYPASTADVVSILTNPENTGPVSICGSRHAMGGQQFGTDTLLMDLSGLKAFGDLDAEKGTVEAGAGMTWPELVDALHTAQNHQPDLWTIRQKQTGADDMTLGGALAANIHGRGLRMRPIIDDVETFTLVDAAGQVLRCSRTENTELFSLAIGGYGCFGIITSVRLRLVRRHGLTRAVRLIHITELMPLFDERVRSGYLFGDFQFNIDETAGDFLKQGVFSCYRPLADTNGIPKPGAEFESADWGGLIYLAHTDRAEGFRLYSDYYLKTDGRSYWSDLHQMGIYFEGYHDRLDERLASVCKGSEMISELYVPRGRLVDFMARTAIMLREKGAVVIYGTIRLIEQDTESFLPWAKERYACIIFNLHTDHTPEGIAASADAFRCLIDIALSLGGSFYLTYHRWAAREQYLAAYPQLPDFLALKSKYDPAHRFQSDWWRHLTSLIGS